MAVSFGKDKYNQVKASHRPKEQLVMSMKGQWQKRSI